MKKTIALLLVAVFLMVLSECNNSNSGKGLIEPTLSAQNDTLTTLRTRTYISALENEVLEAIIIEDVEGDVEYTLIRPDEVSKGSMPPHGTLEFEDDKIIFDFYRRSHTQHPKVVQGHYN